MDSRDHVQNTAEWRDSRAGKITASRISDLFIGPRKGSKESTMRRNYRAQLVCEILSGKAVEEEFQSYEMRRGLELEPTARAEYEIKTGETIRSVGFVPHQTISRAGASPDGLIGQAGMVQFKIVKTAKHLDWLMAKVVPEEHKPQMYFELAVTGREWNDFCAYEPNLPTQHQLFIVRLHRDNVEIEKIENEVRKFNAEIEDVIAKLNGGDDLTGILEASLSNVRG